MLTRVFCVVTHVAVGTQDVQNKEYKTVLDLTGSTDKRGSLRTVRR